MFSSNEKISGRQAFRLLVFDLLGLGTLLIRLRSPGSAGGTAFSALLWEQCLDFYFYAFWCMQWGICRQLCRIYGKNVRDIFRKDHTGGIFSVSDAVSRVYGVSVFCDGVKQPAAGGVFLSCTGADPWTCLVWAVKRD